MFSEEVIQRIKEENNIVDIISETITLKKSGKNYLGRCPFHNEKTPSFTVSSEKQIYKCFGCGEAGNVITFVMKTRSLTFPEAVKFLGKKVGIELEEEGFEKQNSQVKERYKKMYNLNIQAGRFFYTNLKKNEEPYNYLRNRGISDETIRKFGLGFALNDWHGTRNYLKRIGFKEEEILELGLTTKNDKGNIYDRFRNRIIFPVFDVTGRVIGFGGRVLDDSKPKYLNSPETPIFHKGTNLYGLNLAIKNNLNRSIIMVEGYMDVISLSQHGVTNVVATLGTALTEGQCKLLRRYVDTVIVSFDSDAAGQKATLRGLDILLKAGFDIRILQIPKGKDPDEYIRVNGKEAFLKLVDKAMGLTDFRLKSAERGIDFSRKEMIVKYLEEVSIILKKLNPLERAVYIKQVSEKSGVSEEAILKGLGEKQSNSLKNSEIHNINEKFGQKLYLEPAYIKAGRTLLKLSFNKELREKILSKISSGDFALKSHEFIYNIVIDNISLDEEELMKIIEVKTIQNSDLTKEWINIQGCKIDIDKSSVEKMVSDCIGKIKKYKLEESMQRVMKEIKVCESKGLVEESLKLAKELMNIQKEISAL